MRNERHDRWVFRKRFKSAIANDIKMEQDLVDEGSPLIDNAWHRYEGPVEEYDMSFRDILNDLGYASLRDWMAKRHESNLPTHILDVMGGNGAFLRSIGRYGDRGSEVHPALDKSLALTLVDGTVHDQYMQEENSRYGIDILTGDVTSGNTWRKVKDWMQEKSIDGFDLVVCRGVGGIDEIPVPTYAAIGERFYKNTSNKNGLILTQMHEKSKWNIQQWKAAFKKTGGLHFFTQDQNNSMYFYPAGASYPAAGILKTPAAPPSLPKMARY